jgi:alpha-D-xyloside xylohydrolase/trinucleotide repeat-containing gene 6 protein
VWLPQSTETQQGEIDLVNGYLSRDIPVGCLNVDSNWSTGVNNYVWDLEKFPNASAMIAHFHSLNIKVIAWVS